ncbi:MAG: hypothetical protein WC889_08625 [Myxococcota bacterium]|jgi:hypothetical protein
MKKFVLLAVLSVTAAAVAGCDDSIGNIKRQIELHQGGEALLCSTNMKYCTGTACKTCSTSQDCKGSGELCLGPFNTSEIGKYKLNFGKKTINHEWSATVRLADLSTVPATVKSVTFKGDQGRFSVADIPTTIPAKKSVEFTVKYQPTTDLAVDTAIVVVETENSSVPHAEINVFGEGTTSEAIMSVEVPGDEAVTDCRECNQAGLATQLEFGSTPVGGWSDKTARFVNLGPGKMNLTIYKKDPTDLSFTIISPAPDKTGKSTMIVDSCRQIVTAACPQPANTCPEAKELKVRFSPGTSGALSTKLVIENNDTACKTESTITLYGVGSTSVIQVCAESSDCPLENLYCSCTAPEKPVTALVFGDVKEGETVTKNIKLINSGDNDAVVQRVALKEPSLVFSLENTIPPEVTIPGGGEQLLGVTFKPMGTTSEPNSVMIDVQLTGGAIESYEVELKGASEPEICVNPDGMLIFRVAGGGKETLKGTITNCGYAKLTIPKIEVDPAIGNPKAFKLISPAAGSYDVAPGDSLEFSVEFTNNPAVPNETANLNIYNNVPWYVEQQDGIYILTLYSDDNTSKLPPVAVGKAVNGDVQSVKRKDLPLKVELDGTESYSLNVGGSITRYQWDMIVKPQDSTASITDYDKALAYFEADMCDVKYRVRLTVWDNQVPPVASDIPMEFVIQVLCM